MGTFKTTQWINHQCCCLRVFMSRMWCFSGTSTQTAATLLRRTEGMCAWLQRRVSFGSFQIRLTPLCDRPPPAPTTGDLTLLKAWSHQKVAPDPTLAVSFSSHESNDYVSGTWLKGGVFAPSSVLSLWLLVWVSVQRVCHVSGPVSKDHKPPGACLQVFLLHKTTISTGSMKVRMSQRVWLTLCTTNLFSSPASFKIITGHSHYEGEPALS